MFHQQFLTVSAKTVGCRRLAVRPRRCQVLINSRRCNVDRLGDNVDWLGDNIAATGAAVLAGQR